MRVSSRTLPARQQRVFLVLRVVHAIPVLLAIVPFQTALAQSAAEGGASGVELTEQLGDHRPVAFAQGVSVGIQFSQRILCIVPIRAVTDQQGRVGFDCFGREELEHGLHPFAH